jgi:hypothetical protein
MLDRAPAVPVAEQLRARDITSPAEAMEIHHTLVWNISIVHFP